MNRSRGVPSTAPPCVPSCRSRGTKFVHSGLAVLSPGLLVKSLPTSDRGWIGWVALVTFLIAIQESNPRSTGSLGLPTGVVSRFGLYRWLFTVPGYDLRHAILLALHVSAYLTMWSAATAWPTRRHIPLMVSAPALWLAFDDACARVESLVLFSRTLPQAQHLRVPRRSHRMREWIEFGVIPRRMEESKQAFLIGNLWRRFAPGPKYQIEAHDRSHLSHALSSGGTP